MTATNPVLPQHIVGTWTLLSSMTHGGDEVLGTTRLFRTKGWIHEGRKIPLPMVSGNAVRGLWRRACARAFLDAYLAAGGSPVPLSAFYYLTSGGALHKGTGNTAIDVGGETALRQLIPHIGLFGGAGMGKIQEGKLYVDEAIPICRETVSQIAQIWPTATEAETAHLGIRDLVEVHGHSRQDDAKSAHWQQYLAAADAEAVQRKIAAAQQDDVADAESTSQQMRYENVELVAGTVLFHRWGFRWAPTPDEVAGLAAGLLRWAQRPHAGGRNSVGSGNLLLRYEGVSPQTRLLSDGSQPMALFAGSSPEDRLRAHVKEHVKAITEILAVL